MTLFTFETKPCPVCHTPSWVQLDREAFAKWQQGMLIQEAFPKMKPELREQLITGFHPSCWTGLFGSIEETEHDGDRELEEEGARPSLLEVMNELTKSLQQVEVLVKVYAEERGTAAAWVAWQEAQRSHLSLESSLLNLGHDEDDRKDGD